MTAAENIAAVRAYLLRKFTPGIGGDGGARVALAALDALSAELAAADAALSVANETIAMLEDGVTECVGQRDALAARMATLTRELAALQVKFDRHHGFLDAAEVREAQLLSLAEDLALWEPATPEHKAALDGLRALAVQPPDTREPGDAGSSKGRTAAFEAVNLGSSPSPAVSGKVNEPESSTTAVALQGAHQSTADEVPRESSPATVLARDTKGDSGSLTSPAGGAPGGVAEEDEA